MCRWSPPASIAAWTFMSPAASPCCCAVAGGQAPAAAAAGAGGAAPGTGAGPMESTGIRIDVPYLQGLAEEMGGTLQHWNRRQSGSRRTSTWPLQAAGGAAALHPWPGSQEITAHQNRLRTDATVLEKLGNDHPVVPLVLEHRVLSKLKSTYIDALPQLVEAETGRVHTDFNQAVTATGRLSSSNPNPQNIPVRTEYSRRIRKAFLPQEGWTCSAPTTPRSSCASSRTSPVKGYYRRLTAAAMTCASPPAAAGQRRRQPGRTPARQNDQLRDLWHGCPALARKPA